MPVMALNIAVGVTAIDIGSAVHGHWGCLELLVQVRVAARVPGGVVRTQTTTA